LVDPTDRVELDSYELVENMVLRLQQALSS
jgi:hypothetical protein